MDWIEIKEGCEMPKIIYPEKSTISCVVLVSVDVGLKNNPRSESVKIYSHVTEGFYDYSTGKWYDADAEFIPYTVTAWMYEPKPFKKQGEKNV